jgi:PAS domain S-box-containing protein
MLISLLHNLTMIVFITFFFVRLRNHMMRTYSLRQQFWFTSLFAGGFSLAIMLEQFQTEGYFIDLRSLPLLLFSYMGGWRLGLVAAVFPIVWTYLQGGEAVGAVITIYVLLPVLLGAIFHRRESDFLNQILLLSRGSILVSIYFVIHYVLGLLVVHIDPWPWTGICLLLLASGIISLSIVTVILNDGIRRNRTELQLEKAVVERQAILESASEVSMISTDLDGRVTSFNRGSEKMLGYTHAEMIGNQFLAIIHVQQEIEARSRELREQYNEVIEGFEVFIYLCKQGIPETRLWTYRRKDGTMLIVRLSVSAIYNHQGEITGYLGVGSDMTKEFELREELNGQNELLEAQNEEIISQQDELQETLIKIQNHRDLIERIIESNQEGIVLADDSGMIQYANRRMKDYFGFKPAIGKSVVGCCKEMSASIVSPDFRVPQKIIGILHGEQDEFKEKFMFKNSRDELHHYEVLGINIRKKTKTQREYLFIFYNQTAQMELDELKDDLISVISHELRTPMASILGFVEIMLNRQVPPDKQHKYLEIVYKETNRLTHLLNDFLDIQRMESSRQTYKFDRVNLNTVAKDVVEQWQSKRGGRRTKNNSGASQFN